MTHVIMHEAKRRMVARAYMIRLPIIQMEKGRGNAARRSLVRIKRKWAIAPRGKYEAGRRKERAVLNDVTMHEAKRRIDAARAYLIRLLIIQMEKGRGNAASRSLVRTSPP
jgi:hypothetical protein